MPTGTSMAYVAGAGHRPIPLAADLLYRKAHAPQEPKPTGLDWSKLRPTCTSCGQPSSEIDDTTQCPSCRTPAPAPAVVSTPKASKPKTVRTPKVKAPRAPRVRAPQQPKGPSAYAVSRAATERAVVEEYRAGGVLVSELAEKHNRSRVWVRRLLDAHGVERVDERTMNSGGKRRTYDDTVIAEVRRLYVDDRLSRAAVAEQLRVPYKTVVTIMGHEGIPARQGECGRNDGAASLKQRIADLGVPIPEIKAWALREGLLQEVQPGIPPARVVDAYLAAHPASEVNP